MMATVGKGSSLTPLMRQFHEIKDKHPDKILFFRMGDFYEMFGEDAVKAAPVLGIALTSRSQGNAEKTPLAGVPYHAGDKYLAKLLEAGFKVVIVEQVEDPKTAKGLVKREIVEILTPGTATVEDGNADHTPVWLAAIAESSNNNIGLAALDLSTGTFLVDEGKPDELLQELQILDPREIIYPQKETESIVEKLALTNSSIDLTPFEEWNFDYKTASRELNQHFGTSTLDGFGVGSDKLAVTAAGAIYRYLRENHRDKLLHIDRLTRFDSDSRMVLDYATIRNLELVKNLSDSTIKNTLFSIINGCHTAAGSRRLQQALLRPYKTRTAIERRLGGVAEFVRDRDLAYKVCESMKLMPDLEKLSGRLGIGKLNPRQAFAIKESLRLSRTIKQDLANVSSPHLVQLASSIPECDDLIESIDSALVDEPPLTTNKGDIIKRGFSIELDRLNDSIKDARSYIASLAVVEREKTGITSLKVGYNKVFGYYIEVTRLQSDAVPEHYIRKQTLVNAERYITEEMKEKEALILSAEEKIFSLEERLFSELIELLNERIADILHTAHLMAEIDLTLGLAEVAVEHGFCRPSVSEDRILEIKGGRHPVIEAVLPAGSFVSNDISISSEHKRIHILTGPNMSGKSTYLRQIGLIVILAQIGSFVPADSAEVGLVDRVFTRVGAVDNLARGQSTFLVEMVETANILHHATDRSLVLLDEVGRGTSTFDGLSVAWAVVEYINEQSKARTVFATHYHELTSMADLSEHIYNYQVAVKRWGDEVVFLHQIIEGGCDDSYGIEVARLAGLPKKAVSRARQVLRLLESGKFTRSELGASAYKEKMQPSLFDQKPSEIEERIRLLDIDRMTPLDALNMLRELKDDLS